MTRRTKLWFVAAAAVFTLINAGGVVYTVIFRELLHGATHVAGLFLGVYLMLWLARRPRRQNPSRPQLTEQHLEYLQRSVDAMALEVERIGEAQRFSDKLRAERGESTLPNQDR